MAYAVDVGAWIVSRLAGDHEPVDDVLDRYSDAAEGGCYLLGVLLVSVALALVWSAVDSRRTSGATLQRWMRASARWTIAGVMLVYTLGKVVPTQFGYLPPSALGIPFGRLQRFYLLWNFMAVSTAYTVLTGLVELVGSVLLLFRNAAVVGALVLAGVLANVIALDVCYRVPTGALFAAALLLTLVIVVLCRTGAPAWPCCSAARSRFPRSRPRHHDIGAIPSGSGSWLSAP